MKNIIILIFACILSSTGISQGKYFTRSGKITFHSSTPMENIEARNKTVVSIFDTKTGQIEFAVTMKSFQFEKALMQEHFNENYVESSKYPKATFKGKITNIAELNLSKDGVYTVTIEGDLTIHGKTQKIKTDGSMTVKGESVNGKANLTIKPESYDIKIPGAVKDNIAKEIKVDVDMNYTPFKR